MGIDTTAILFWGIEFEEEQFSEETLEAWYQDEVRGDALEKGFEIVSLGDCYKGDDFIREYITLKGAKRTGFYFDEINPPYKPNEFETQDIISYLESLNGKSFNTDPELKLYLGFLTV